MELLPYQVYDPGGKVVLQAAESCRYPRLMEAALLDAGYTIRLKGTRITKTCLRKEVSRK